MNPKAPLALILANVLVAGSSFAATISWSVFNIANDLSQVSTTGTLHASAYGLNGGATASFDGLSETINGVQFTDASTLDSATNQDNIGSRAGTYTGQPTPGFRQLFEHGSRNTANADQSITFSGLTIGHAYQIQLWFTDNVGTAGTQGLVLGNGSAAAPTYGVDTTLLFEVTEGGYGQYGLGVFTANAATQSFKLRKWGNLTTTPVAQSNTYVNAWQIRDLGVIPEPSTALLGGLGALLLLRRRRH